MNGKVKIKLDNESIKFISVFESMTGAHVKDCIINDEKIYFIVKQGHAGLAIGKSGSNIKNLQRSIKKNVEIIEFAESISKFLNNIFRPLTVDKVSKKNHNGKKIIRVKLNNKRSRMIIKSKIKKAKFFIKKYFGIDELVLG